jgi:hypothetical protein
MKTIIFAVVSWLLCNFIVGVLREYCPEVLPPILRKGEKEMIKNFKMVIAYEGI